MKILNEYFGLPENNTDHKLIERSLYKHTQCGAWIVFEDDGIVLGSIVEGCDFGTETYPLAWHQITHDAISERINAIEEEADALWKWANTEDQTIDPPYFDFDHLNPKGRSA